MKILRSVNRRGLGTESIGFYALLKPNRWFPASRLPAHIISAGQSMR